MSAPATASILAIIVVYGKSLRESATFQSLAASLWQADALLDMFVYDNSPEPMLTEPIAIDGPFRLTFHHDPANAGISAAYNVGALLARKMGKKWLLLLDQDTNFPPEAVATYAKAVSKSGDVTLFAPRLVAGDKLLSPCGYLAGIGYHLGQVPTGALALTNRAVFNSGILVQLAAFEACGGYDERVRVDFADFAFMNRFRQRYQEVMVLDLICEHGFSNLEEITIEAALGRFNNYCLDGRAAAATPLLKLTHALLVLRRSLVLTLRYGSCRFLAKLPLYFSGRERMMSS